MDRRDFLKTTGSAAAVAAVAPAVAAPIVAAHAEIATQGRRPVRAVLPINRSWRFSAKREADAHQLAFDDSAFERVTVPHTNIRLPWHSFDDRASQFVSIYRRHFKLPAEARGRRVFVDFEGVMTASKVWLNGVSLGEYRGGYTPFSFELTEHLDWHGDNVLAVDVDSTERADIPPFGYSIDYLTFGGIYREVALRFVNSTFLENVFAQPQDVLGAKPGLVVECHLTPEGKELEAGFKLEATLFDGDKVVAKAAQAVDAGAAKPATVKFVPLDGIELWDLKNPKLYTVEVRLLKNGVAIDNLERHIGFREAKFTAEGFKLNGKAIKLRGLDRHQTFPWVGQAMPGRVQRKDAEILRHELKCNIVRTSHYPQSRHFLDACDEIGLLVLEEIPGWQHIGDLAWQDLAVDNVGRMIQRDWNHPSIVLWGVRINESPDNHDFYTRTNKLAHELDPTRQTGGIRNRYESELLEDVFTINDFGFPLREPNHACYLNTEFAGHTYPTKTIDNVERLREHTLRHVRVHDQVASKAQYAGAIGWCAFDYNTHKSFGSGDRICYHGVMDIFRTPKPAAGFYRSQCEPEEEVVLEPNFHFAEGDENSQISKVVVSTNCEQVKFFLDDKPLGEASAMREAYPHLKYAPFEFDLGKHVNINEWGNLKLEGWMGGKVAITKMLSGSGVDAKFEIKADDLKLLSDGADSTRVVFRVTDEFGAPRPFANTAIKLEIVGPAELIGDNPFGLVGGVGAVWIRAYEVTGKVELRATHPFLGIRKVEFEIAAAKDELI